MQATGSGHLEPSEAVLFIADSCPMQRMAHFAGNVSSGIHMRKYMWWTMPWALLAVVGILWSRFHQPRPGEATTAVAPATTPETLHAAPIEPTAPAVAIPTTAQPASTDSTTPLFVEGLEATLRADDAGSLILDTETRNALEMLIGMSAREREQRIQRLRQQLPAVAASQALDLLPRLTEYRNAALQMFPADAAPTTLAQARAALLTIHQLRVDSLGEDAAGKLFGRDEAMARMLFESMGRNNPENRTPEQEARLSSSVRSAFALLVLPRQPTRAIGQQDP